MTTLQKQVKRQRKLISLDKPSLQIKQRNQELFQILKLSKEGEVLSELHFLIQIQIQRVNRIYPGMI
jgi:hypothetical protein